MEPLPLAAAQELVFLGAALAVALLLAFQLRLAQRFRMLDMEVRRLAKAHKEGTLDARSRLEEASKALEALEETVTPRLAGIEPHLADVGARIDDLEERLARLVPALEAVGRRESEAEEVLADARSRLERAEEVAQAAGERSGVVEEGVRDVQRRLEQAEEGIDRLRTALDERLDAIDQKVATLETVPAAAPRRPTRTALGLAERGGSASPASASEPADAGAEEAEGGEAGASARLPDASPHHAEEHEDMSRGMRGLLVGVILLAALTMLLHWMGVGR